MTQLLEAGSQLRLVRYQVPCTPAWFGCSSLTNHWLLLRGLGHFEVLALPHLDDEVCLHTPKKFPFSA